LALCISPSTMQATEGRVGPLITEQTIEHYHQGCDVNILGLLLSMKHEIAAMLRSGGGAIVNNSSIGGHRISWLLSLRGQ
jgi:NADP-dependent 3-hydroxy acid dehydrogenase YdfG